MHRQLRAAARRPRYRHDVRDAHQRVVLELDAARRELLRVQRHLHRRVGRSLRRRHAVQRIAFGEVRAVHNRTLPAEAAAVLRAAAEAAARHRHVGAARHRPALKVEARHHRLSVVREAYLAQRVLLAVQAHLERSVLRAEAAAHRDPHVVERVAIHLVQARPCTKAHDPRERRRPALQHHALKQRLPVVRHAQPLVGVGDPHGHKGRDA